MKILYREPVNQPLQIREVENEIESIEKLVGGYTHIIQLANNVICIYNEDGKMQNLSNNFYHYTLGWIPGNCIFCGVDVDEFTSLTSIQIRISPSYN